MNKIAVIPLNEPGRKAVENSSLTPVLLIVDQFPRTLGGGERIVLKMAEMLPEYGYSASVLTFSAHPECINKHIQSSSCPIYLLPLHSAYNLTALRSSLVLRRFIDWKKIKIVQTFFESSDIWGGLVTKTMTDAKLIWSRRDMGILRSCKHRVAYRLMADLPDAVFAVSEQVRQKTIDVDGVPKNRVITIYNGLDIARWDNRIRTQHRPGICHITTVGNIRRIKGHDLFIRAAASIAESCPDIEFSIAGEILEQDYYQELLTLIDEQRLNGRFHLLGGIDDLPQHLASANIFVLPSRSEGFSNSIIEAMAASLPVIATIVGGNSEAVEDQVSGLLVPAEDSAALAKAILRLANDPREAERMGDAGRAIVSERFTTEAMMRRIASVYKVLVPSKESQPPQ